MTVEMFPSAPDDQNPDQKHSKLHIGRDTLIVAAGIMVSMSAGLTPVLSVMLVRESIRFLEGKVLHHKEKP
jgi:hypothetical protein